MERGKTTNDSSAKTEARLGVATEQQVLHFVQDDRSKTESLNGTTEVVP
jgi:hypothetical protein